MFNVNKISNLDGKIFEFFRHSIILRGMRLKAMKYHIIIFFLIISFFSYSQSQKKIDSIKGIISLANSDFQKTIEYLRLGYNFSNKDSTIFYYNKSLKIARDNNFPERISSALVSVNIWTEKNVSREKAIEQHHSAIKELIEYNYMPGIANNYFRLGYKYFAISKLDSVQKYVQMGLAISNEIGDNSVTVTGLHTLGNVEYYKGQFKDALNYYKDAEKICVNDSLLKISLKYASILEAIGVVNAYIENYNNAYDYYLKSKEIVVHHGNQKSIQSLNLRIGSLLFNQDSLDASLTYLNPSIAYFDSFLVKDVNLLEGLYIRGSNYLKQSKTKLAEKDFNQLYEIAIKNGNSQYERISYYNLGELYTKTKAYDKAIKNYKLDYELSVEFNDIGEQKDALSGLINVFKIKKDYKNLAESFEKYILVKDSIDIIALEGQLAEVESKFQTEKKQNEINKLKAKNIFTEQQKEKERNLYLGGIGFTTLVGLFLLLLVRNRQKVNKKLREVDQLKTNFFSNISHEFRTPLTLISGPIEDQLMKKDLCDEERDTFTMVKRNSDRLLELVNQLLEISKIESGGQQIELIKDDLSVFIGALQNGFIYSTEQKQIDYVIKNDITKNLVWFDKDIIEKILVNLISNAVKYTSKKGKIIISSKLKKGHLIFEIKNTGKGLTEEELNNIFERFYQSKNNNAGSGLGLALVKNLVLLHKGEISVKSTADQWTAFKVKLPVSKEYFNENEIIRNREIDCVEKAGKPEKHNNLIKRNDSGIKEDSTIVLVVDDNTDIRTYISNLCKDSYKILQAENGKEGVGLAIKYVPDIIISDVMMPVMTGIELCNALKNDERTSHIPIVLLTAKAGKENELEGVKTGADDYITKPFNSEILKLKVGNLIESRKKLRNRYSQELVLKPKDIAVTPTDELFFKKIQIILDEHLSNPDFSATSFSNRLIMSRMQLHRKLMAYTGLSTTAFIRSQRLKQAVHILKTSDATINEVAYTVGFNTPSYFIKCFREAYNKTPAEYLNSPDD